MASHDMKLVHDFAEFNLIGSHDNNTDVSMYKKSCDVLKPRITKNGYEIHNRKMPVLLWGGDKRRIGTGIYFEINNDGFGFDFYTIESDLFSVAMSMEHLYLTLEITNLTDDMIMIEPYCVLGYIKLTDG